MSTVTETIEEYNARVMAEQDAEPPELRRARFAVGQLQRLEDDYRKAKHEMERLAIECVRKAQVLKVQLDQLANRHPDNAATGWVTWWRKIGCPWYAEHGRPD